MPKAKMLDTKTKVNINAENLFTDREKPRKAFWDLYNAMENGDYEVIAYYGVGGIGKTTLLKQIGKEIDERVEDGKLDHLFISFEGKPEKEMVLYMISRQLMICNKGLRCALFDEAFGKLLELTGKSSEPYEKQMRSLISDNPILSTVVGFANDVSPVSGVIGVAASAIDGIVSFSRNKIKEKEMAQGENAHIYNEIKYSDAKELRKNLHQYLRIDIQEYMGKRTKPFVFLVDGYENFVDIRETGKESMNLEKDEWLKNPDTGLIPIPNTIWVVAGREMPHWDDEVLPKDHMHRIGDLSMIDAISYFEKAGIGDSKLREDLYKLTNGTPAYMDMCVETYRRINREKEPAIEDFGKNTSELASRFLENMNKNMRQMIYILAGLSTVFTKETAINVAEKLEKRECISALDEILVMSLIEPVDQGYKLHRTLKDVIVNEHKNDSNTEEVPIVMQSSIVEMKTIAERLRSSSDSNDRIDDVKNYTELIWNASYDGIEEDTWNIIIIIKSETDATGNYILCEELMSQYVEFLDKNSLNDKLKVYASNIRNFNLHQLGEFGQFNKLALTTYQYAKERLGEEHPDTLTSLNNLAISYGDAGDNQTALELKKKCYELCVKILGEEHPDTLRILNNLAKSYGDAGDNQTALELTKKCYELRVKNLGEEHPYTLLSLNNLAISYEYAGDNQTALELMKKCYELSVKILGEDHPDTLVRLEALRILNDLT